MVFTQGLLTDGESIIQEMCCLLVFILIPAVQSQLVTCGLDTTACSKQNHEQHSSLHKDQPSPFSLPQFIYWGVWWSKHFIYAKTFFERQSTGSWEKSLSPECVNLVN